MNLFIAILITILIAIMVTWTFVYYCNADEIPFTKENIIRAAVGEASGEGYQGLLAVATAIYNRGTLKGVYGVNAKHIESEPEWVWTMASRAQKQAKKAYFEGVPMHSGTHWENIKAFGTPYWVEDMIKVYEYKDHIFYKEK